MSTVKRVASGLALMIGGAFAIASCALGADDAIVPNVVVDAGIDAGSVVVCTTNDECPKSSRPCLLAACDVTSCYLRPTARGVVVAKHLPADCHSLVCDGEGDTETIVDRTNAPPSDAACFVGTCDASGNPGLAPAAKGLPCTSQFGGQHCDGAGNCVECLDDTDCPVGQTCDILKFCEAPLCKDGFKDSHETDVDCGGVCPPCGAGRNCKIGADCTSGACDSLTHTCLRATCSDGIKDDNETDVDCGGECSTCALGRACAIDQDCASKACDLTLLVCIADQCSDGRKENLETDVDCGGGQCPGCADGKACRYYSDCLSGVCDATQTCIPYVNPCTNGVKDPNETDVDCGGGQCPGCALGKACFNTWDCASLACDGISATCISDHCVDHRFDSNESDIDCGGPNTCARCPLGRRCTVDTDCDVGLACAHGNPHVCL